MRIVMPEGSAVWLRRGHRALFAVAVVALGYSGYVLADASIFQHRANAQLERLVRYAPNAVALPGEVKGKSPEDLGSVPDGLVGRIAIARLGMSAIVMEGTTEETLRRAAGHVEGTALPGSPGNMAIAGHRDTLFRPLQNVRIGDIVTMTTAEGEFRYRVVSTRVVSPDDVSVLRSGAREILTLVTCYPFYYVGPAPDRFIVRAERVT